MVLDPLIFYAVERILAVAIGGLSIVLGYRLFLQVPIRADSSGEFKLPWNISLGLTRVGPGAFFALFGAAVVGYSLHGSVRVSEGPAAVNEGAAARNPAVSRAVEATGATQSTDGPSLAAQRLNGKGQIRFLNQLGAMARNDLSAEDQRALNARPAEIKVELMRPLWSADWGDLTKFIDWAEGGASGSPPAGSEAAADYFRFGAQGPQ